MAAVTAAVLAALAAGVAPEISRGAQAAAAACCCLAMLACTAVAVRGNVLRFVLGMLFLYMAGVGVAAICLYGWQGILYCMQGGVMIAGAVGQFCIALVGAIFLCVFGFLTTRVMTRSLWPAGICLGLALLAAGVAVNARYTVAGSAAVPAQAGTEPQPAEFLMEDGAAQPEFKIAALPAGNGLDCRVTAPHRGRMESYNRHLDAGETLVVQGWQLRAVEPQQGAAVQELRLVRAPGRILAHTGALGALLCGLLALVWKRKEKTAAAVQQDAAADDTTAG